MNVTDQWAWWRAALAGTFGTIQADEPQAGFYETRSKNRATGVETRGVVAYWYRDGNLFCKNGTGMLDDLHARERWPYASKRPIAKEVYDSVRSGKGWPDEHPAAAADRNNGPEPDSFEELKDRIEDLAREAEAIIKNGAAQTKDAADQAADLADRLLAREKLADSKRAAEKKVHDDAGKAIQKKWLPLVTRAGDAKAMLKKFVITPFLVTASKVAENAPRQVGTTSTVSLRTVTTAVIEDYPRALTFFAGNEKVRELIQQLANASVRAGTTPDGCRVHTEQAAA